ncbi:MmcB family DNA repair protein [Bacillus sp. FJAT-26390]|uniref:MmcB family DNA repair protein n=1 Tax=Bacillus sp. FJAT-26390 TaxID=1743142 RepID=UPI0009E5E6F1|nr:MmcB family DNA repair protein [Bacillus sp. FJAT-26390]
MKVKAEHIKQALASKHSDDLFMTEVKTGRTWNNSELLKFDAFAMKKSWANPCIYGYEVKVSRADFLKDQKWPGYMAYCHRFAFVCPKGLIQPEELPDEVGLIWFYPDSGALRSARPAKHRIVDIPSDLYQYILMSRIDSDRLPFYSSAREYFEAWIADKKDRRMLGAYVSEKLQKELGELNRISDEAKRYQDRHRSDLQLLREVTEILRVNGISMHSWNTNWQDELRKALVGGANPKASRALERLIDNAEELKRMLGEVNES